MKVLYKKIIFIAFSLLLVVSLFGCKSTQKPQPQPQTQTQVYSKTLSKYFPSTQGTTLKYSGTDNHSHTLKLSSVSDTTDKLTLKFNGNIDNVSTKANIQNQNQANFEVDYVVDNNSVKEVEKGLDKKYVQSIITDQTVLKTPLQKGNKWTQSVTIGDMTYNAETSITDVTSEGGKSIVKTQTTVTNINGYPNNTYKETRSYKEGVGLYSFNNTILLKDSATGKITPYDFSYKLSTQK